MKKILLLLSVLLWINFISSLDLTEINYRNHSNSYCYQETTTTLTSCGGLSTGTYSGTGSAWRDGSWNTFTGAVGLYSMNYTKNNSHYNKAIWQVSDVFGSVSNLTIPYRCYNHNANTLILYANITSAGNDIWWYCWDGDYVLLKNTSVIGSTYLYEEAIFWSNVHESELFLMNSSYNFTRYLKIPENEFLTKFYMDINSDNIIYNNFEDGTRQDFTTGTATTSNAMVGSYSLLTNGESYATFTTSTKDYLSYYVNSTNVVDSLSMNTYLSGTTLTSIALAVWMESNYLKYYTTTTTSVPFYQISNNTVYKIELKNINYDTHTYDIWVNGIKNVTNARFVYYVGDYRDSIGTIRFYPSTGSYYTIDEVMFGNNTYPENLTIFINNEQGYKHSLTLNESNITNNLAGYVNNYLGSCTYDSGYCYVPLNFQSDSLGYIKYNNLIINDYDFLENSQTFDSVVYGNNLETYSINLTYNSVEYPLIIANLIYNGSSYSGTKSTSGIYNTFTTNVQIPDVSIDTIKTFYWNIALTNTSGTYYYNSTFNNQTLIDFEMGICTPTLNITALNFTAYSEKTLERLYNVTLKGNFEYFIGSSTSPKSLNFTNLSTSELDFCISNHVNYTISGLIQASLTDYNPTEYNFINFIVNNQTQNYYLYLLNISSTTPFIIKVQGQNQLPLENYYVYIYRYDPGNPTPYLIQAVKTDSLGQTIGLFETYTIDYKFLIYDDEGNLVYTSEKMKIIPTTTPYTLTFTVGSILPSPTTYFDNLTGVTWTLGYNKNTYVASLSYSDSNTSFQYGQFIVKGLNMSGSDKVICNLTSSNPSAVLTCDLTGNMSGGYVAEFYVNRNNVLVYVDSLPFDINTISQIVGMLGVLGAFFLILFACFAFFANEVAGILSVNFAVFLCEVLGLINIGIVGISSIIGISILIIVVLVRNQ